MRTTRKEVEGVFKLWLVYINGGIAEAYNNVNGYRLDYNSVYGGYRIEQVCNEHGGVRDVFATRLKTSEFVAALRVAMRSIEEKDRNPVTVKEMNRVIDAAKAI